MPPLCALRGVLKTAWRLGQINAEDYYRAVNVRNIKGEILLTGRELHDEEVTRLLEACAADPTAVGARDGAIIDLMYSCSLRRNEVINLDLEDYDPSSGLLKVMGKRRKERTAYLLNAAGFPEIGQVDSKQRVAVSPVPAGLWLLFGFRISR